jgi:hypothetical protein
MEEDWPVGRDRATEIAGRKLPDNRPANFVANRANGFTADDTGLLNTGAAEAARSAQRAVATKVITITCRVRCIYLPDSIVKWADNLWEIAYFVRGSVPPSAFRLPPSHYTSNDTP